MSIHTTITMVTTTRNRTTAARDATNTGTLTNPLSTTGDEVERSLGSQSGCDLVLTSMGQSVSTSNMGVVKGVWPDILSGSASSLCDCDQVLNEPIRLSSESFEVLNKVALYVSLWDVSKSS